MRKWILTTILCLSACAIAGSAFAGSVTWGNENTRPQEILDRVVWNANRTNKIQDTQLDGVSSTTNQQFAGQYKIANTLNSIRVGIAPYLQWFMFIWLTVATVLIIITGFQLVTSIQSGMDSKKALGRIKNIAIGIAVLTWFYIITRLFMSLLGYFLT
jgi:hypothetical protein